MLTSAARRRGSLTLSSTYRRVRPRMLANAGNRRRFNFTTAF
jgi:hypothetical protein